MLVNAYIEALLVDKKAADNVWEAWNQGRISKSLAAVLWMSISCLGEEYRDASLSSSVTARWLAHIRQDVLKSIELTLEGRKNENK